MGGEKQVKALPLRGGAGSPPHGRGKVYRLRSTSRRWRITPAWAGKSPLVTRLYALAEDHPRMGGEKTHPSYSPCATLGSPPHGRGKDCFSCVFVHRTRITPAWAGKSDSPSGKRNILWDHPRMGGEKHGEAAARCSAPGSPPHGRGKAHSLSIIQKAMRITPAWAGKSALQTLRRSVREDHPRMGGEKLMYAALLKYLRGSPPHGRGKDHFEFFA